MIIYVDDMIISADDKEEFRTLKQQLSWEFEMKDIGQLKYFLGIEIEKGYVPQSKEIHP